MQCCLRFVGVYDPNVLVESKIFKKENERSKGKRETRIVNNLINNFVE